MGRASWRWAIGLAGLLLVGHSARWGAQAQGLPRQAGGRPQPAAGEATRPASVQDALLRPASLPFRDPTTLDDVARHLRDHLRIRVVLDRAALRRKAIPDDATVQLQLDDVRLKTGLQLLLDQLDLTYRVVPEDNLLILTDAQGSDDPARRVLDELETIHREIHDLQDTVASLYDELIPPVEGGEPELRNPTLIEELPGPPQPGEPRPALPEGSRPG